MLIIHPISAMPIPSYSPNNPTPERGIYGKGWEYPPAVWAFILLAYLFTHRNYSLDDPQRAENLEKNVPYTLVYFTTYTILYYAYNWDKIKETNDSNDLDINNQKDPLQELGPETFEELIEEFNG